MERASTHSSYTPERGRRLEHSRNKSNDDKCTVDGISGRCSGACCVNSVDQRSESTRTAERSPLLSRRAPVERQYRDERIVARPCGGSARQVAGLPGTGSNVIFLRGRAAKVKAIEADSRVFTSWKPTHASARKARTRPRSEIRDSWKLPPPGFTIVTRDTRSHTRWQTGFLSGGREFRGHSRPTHTQGRILGTLGHPLRDNSQINRIR